MIQYFRYLSALYKYRQIREHNRFVKPVFINYLCTFKCNARCKMCNIWDIYRKDKSGLVNEISAEELSEILKRNKAFLSDVRHVGITGGDPLMKRDIVDFVRVFRGHLPNAAIGMQTNGLAPKRLEKLLIEILDFYPEFSLAVSIDGVGKIHDETRGIPGAFESALESIRVARKLGIKRITTGMTLTSINAHQIKEVAALAKSLGTEFSCFMAEECDYFNNKGIGNSLTPDQKKQVISDLKTNTSYHYYMDKMRRGIELGEKRSLRCYSGHTSLVWDPYGNVKPCILRSEMFGNLKTNSLEEMLFNSAAMDLKDDLKKCSCWCQCEVSSSSVVDMSDVIKWFFLQSNNRIGFIRHMLNK